MLRLKITGVALVAVLAMGAVVMSNASARSPIPSLRNEVTKAALAPGAVLIATSTNVLFMSPAGNVECSKSALDATLTTNGARKDKASTTKGSFTGTEDGTLCPSTWPEAGPAEVTMGVFPLQTTFTTGGKYETKGNLTFTFTFPYAIGGYNGVTCVFEAKKLKGTFNTNGSPITLATIDQEGKLKKPAPRACPNEGQMNATWSLITPFGLEPVYLGTS